LQVFCFEMGFKLRPCVRWNFLNFSFSWVSEKFGCQSSKIFRKKTEFSNSQNFREKVWKKVRKFKFRKKFGNYSKMYVNFGNFEKSMQRLSFWVKNPCFGVKKFGKSSEMFGNWVFKMFGNFGNFGNCSFPNSLKITKKWR